MSDMNALSYPEALLRVAYEAAARQFGCTAEELLRHGDKHAPLPRARHLAWWILVQELGWGVTRTAALAGVHHGAVSHGLRQTKSALDTENEMQDRATECLALFRIGAKTIGEKVGTA